jgi:hypothetical protein
MRPVAVGVVVVAGMLNLIPKFEVETLATRNAIMTVVDAKLEESVGVKIRTVGKTESVVIGKVPMLPVTVISTGEAPVVGVPDVSDSMEITAMSC